MTKHSTVDEMLQRFEKLPHFPTVIHALVDAVAQAGDNTALVCEGKNMTYNEFSRAVVGMADLLTSIAVADSVVTIMMTNSIEMVVAVSAVMAAQAQAAPVNPFYPADELVPALQDANSRVLICDDICRDKAQEVADRLGIEHLLTLGSGDLLVDNWIQNETLVLNERHLPAPEDFALMIYTGGTTGIPKGVNHRHRGLSVSLVQHCTMWPIEFGRERFLSVAPMFHIWGLVYGVFIPIYCRSTLAIVPKYDPDKVLQAIDEHKTTIFGGGPAAIFSGLRESPLMATTDFSSLKYCLTGGSACPEELHRAWKKRTGCALLEAWGMSECAPLCLTPAWGEQKLLSVGLPVPELEVQVVDLEFGTTQLAVNEAGEIRVKGPQQMDSYRNRPEETAATVRDGWLYTGDIGYIDDDGYLFLIDRKKEMVNVGGFNVYPRQVDEVLFKHPKIFEVATVGVPHDRLGEVLVAYVVHEKDEAMTAEEFYGYCQEHLVKYKRPTKVTFLDELPKTGAKKIDKKALKQWAASSGKGNR